MRKFRDIREVADYIKSHVDIVSEMSKVVNLEKAGNDLYKALCCFHVEKTPSLTVTPSKGLYHCFGCHASGDVINFVKDTRNVSTVEAIRYLANEYNLDLSRFERDLTIEEKRLMEMMEVNKAVRDRLHEQLMRRDNRGYEYLTKERGLNEETIKEFGLGYSRYPQDVISNTPWDKVLELDRPAMWTDAVVYPLHDPYGNVIGFKTRPYWNGRTVDEHGRKLPKFVGTSTNSPLHSGNHLYGLHIARRHIKNGRLIGVEGQHDVLKLHQAGIKYVVGTDGTNFNKEKLQTLQEFGIREFVVLLDGDDAGRESSLKIAEESLNNDTSVSIRIAKLPDGYDPDTFIDEYGATALLRIIHESVYPSQYLVDNILSQMSLNSVTSKLDFVHRVKTIIARTRAIEQKFLIDYVAEKVGVDPLTIEDTIKMSEANMSKYPLHNIEGERIVLGGILKDEEFRHEVIQVIRDDDWYLPRHREMFVTIRQMYNDSLPISPETLKMTINNRGLGKLFQDGVYVDEVYNSHGDYWVIFHDLMDKAVRRRLIKEAHNLNARAQNLSERVVFVIEDHISKIQQSFDTPTDSLVDGKQGANQFMRTLHERMANAGQIVGISLGDNWRSTTSILNGIQRKKLITIAANQSVGKTTLLCNWLNEIAISQGLPWLHFSLEMPAEEVILKIIGLRAGVDSMRIQRGNLSDEEYARVSQAAQEYYNGGLIIDDRHTTLEQIISLSRKLVYTKGIRGVSIDYIQLMQKEHSKSRQRYEELGEISGGLKNDLAKKLDIPVIILSQLSKSATDAAIAKAEHGAGSYKIAQDSDVYITLKEKSEEEIEQWGIEKGNIVMNIDKNRMGRGDVLLDVLFQKDLQRMMEVYG